MFLFLLKYSYKKQKELLVQTDRKEYKVISCATNDVFLLITNSHHRNQVDTRVSTYGKYFNL